MQTYELAYIISSEITSEEAGAKAKEIESAIQKEEGTILKRSNPIAKMLSYPIKGFSSGFFGVLEFQLEPEKMAALKKTIEKDGKIIRHMLIIKKAAELKKERRTRGASKVKPIAGFEPEHLSALAEKTEVPKGYPEISEPAAKPSGKEKVELKDIEQELNEILGE